MFRSLPKLMRLGVSLAVTFSAITGYLVCKGMVDSGLFFTFAGVLLLASGASALNQYQERKTDLLMKRTCNRPIPSKKIHPFTGLITALILCFGGLLTLFFYTGVIPALLGLFNLLWYNGFYTYLKRKTAFAVVPGSLTGVTPVLIGWSSAGGYLLDPTIIFISFFLYMWQVPHFWLLLIKYNHEYQKAGLGNLSHIFTETQAKRIVFAWILGTSATSLFFPYFGIIRTNALVLLLFIANIGAIVFFTRFLFKKMRLLRTNKAFLVINVFMFIVMLMLILESFI